MTVAARTMMDANAGLPTQVNVQVASSSIGPSTAYGYNPPSGSALPSTLLGFTIQLLAGVLTFNGHYQIEFELPGPPGQSLFTSLTVDGFVFTSASATYSAGLWVWDGGTGASNEKTVYNYLVANAGNVVPFLFK